jgi:hypothetical protein
MTPKQKRLSRVTYITDEDRTIAMRDDEARARVRETAKTVLIAFAIMFLIIGIAMVATAASAQTTLQGGSVYQKPEPYAEYDEEEEEPETGLLAYEPWRKAQLRPGTPRFAPTPKIPYGLGNTLDSQGACQQGNFC